PGADRARGGRPRALRRIVVRALRGRARLRGVARASASSALADLDARRSAEPRGAARGRAASGVRRGARALGSGVTLAWLLNLDADDELADPRRATAPAVAERIRALAPRTGLVAPGDVLLDGKTRADGVAARAWMPTPRALAAIASAGATPPRAPSFDVL